MKVSTGNWVSGDDFFGRGRELDVLESRVRERNHVLLTGQRRMGKTSVARELGRRLERQEWVFLFADLEAATCAEDAVAEIAAAARIAGVARSVRARAAEVWRGFRDRIEEVGAGREEFRMKFRGELNAGNWRRCGGELIRACAEHERPALLVMDELPIFLKRMLRDEQDGRKRVDEFLSWLRREMQDVEGKSLSLIVSGSIGLEPLVRRLSIPDRINHFYSFRLGPWDRRASIECFELLAGDCGLSIEDDVAAAVYKKLGIGIPHHVQSFFARLQDFAAMQGRDRLTAADVEEVYRTQLLGPSGQNDLVHYETRLAEGLAEKDRRIAMEILAEAAAQQAFGADARRGLERLYSRLVDDAPARIADTLEVLEHDGYLQADSAGVYRFPSHLLRDYFKARFAGHHAPLASRRSDGGGRTAP